MHLRARACLSMHAHTGIFMRGHVPPCLAAASSAINFRRLKAVASPPQRPPVPTGSGPRAARGEVGWAPRHNGMRAPSEAMSQKPTARSSNMPQHLERERERQRGWPQDIRSGTTTHAARDDPHMACQLQRTSVSPLGKVRCSEGKAKCMLYKPL